jgi:hypothetical protein
MIRLGRRDGKEVSWRERELLHKIKQGKIVHLISLLHIGHKISYVCAYLHLTNLKEINVLNHLVLVKQIKQLEQ